MTPKLILLGSFTLFWWLIKKDTATRPGISGAVWIATLWEGILASRPVSAWTGFGGGEDSLEGSPLDRLFFFGLIFAALYVLSKRRLNWSEVISRNWPVFVFYFYLLLSVVWADSPFVAFKRWFKEFGNICIALVILTEVDLQQAFRAVFARCAYVLLPLSVIFIRWFPQLGRRYNPHTGEMEAIGVTFQKNSLGAMVLVCGIILIWDWMERSRPGSVRQGWFRRLLPLILLGTGIYLIRLCDSKTSIVCLLLGGTMLAATRLPFLRNRISAYGKLALLAIVIFFALDSMIGIKEELVQSMGRDMTFTGRTDVWRELLALDTNPLIGAGFCSFWSDDEYQAKLPEEVRGGRSAHNGYLEMYIDGGWIGIALLVLMLLGTARQINRQLAASGNYAVVRFAILAITLIANFSESHFGKMSPIGFLFLLAALETPLTASQSVSAEAPAAHPVNEEMPNSVPLPN